MLVTIQVTALLFCGLLAAGMAPAQGFNVRKYTTADGLAGSSVNTVFEDSRGFLWAGTYNGLSRFDGRNFVNYTTRQGLHGNFVRFIAETPAGQLLVGTDQRLHRFNGIGFDTIAVPGSGGVKYYFQALPAQGGMLLIINFKCYRLSGAVLQPLAPPLPGVLAPLLRAWVPLPGGDTLVCDGRRNCYSLYRGQARLLYAGNDTTTSGWVQAGADSTIIANKFGFWLWHKRRLTRLCAIEEYCRDELFSVTIDTARNIWMTVNNAGIFIYNLATGRLTRLHNKNNPAVFNTIALTHAADGYTSWAADVFGLLKITPAYHTTFTKETYPQLERHKFFAAPDGTLYCGAENGLYQVLHTPAGLRFSRLRYEAAPNPVQGVTQDAEGNHWFYTFRGCLYRRRAGSAVVTDLTGKLFPRRWAGISTILYSRHRNAVVVPYPGRLILIRGADTTTIPFPAGYENHLASWMAEDAGGGLWVLGGALLMKLQGNTLISYPQLKPRLGDNYTGLCISGYRLLCSISGDGLYEYDIASGQPVLAAHYTTEQGLQDNFPSALAADAAGRLFIAGQRAVQVLEKMPGGAVHIRPVTDDGIHSRNLGNEYVHMCRDTAGNIWCSMWDGLLHIQPPALRLGYRPPQVYITGVSGAPGLPQPAGSSFTTAVLPAAFSSGSNISIRFTAVHLRNGQVTYACKLEGAGNQWVYNQVNEEVTYYNLGPGVYTFHCKAVNLAGQQSPVVTYRFRVLPAWWQTVWFRVLLGLLAVAVLYFIIKRREKTQAEKNRLQLQLSELKMQALRSQMNPHFIFNALNSIQFFIMDNDPGQAVRYLSKFAKLMRLVLDNSGQNTISIYREKEWLGLYLEIEQLRFKNKFTWHIQIDEAIDAGHTCIPQLMIQPHVENALLHGITPLQGRGRLQITLTACGPGRLQCVVEDDGIGRAAALKKKQGTLHQHESRATGIFRKRMELMPAGDADNDFFIEDLYHPDGRAAGTRVRFILPLLTKPQ